MRTHSNVSLGVLTPLSSRSEQSQALSKYLAAPLVAVSLHIASDSVPQFAYPREESELYMRQTRSRAVAAQLKGRAGGETDLNMLTPLLSIIHPPIRTVRTCRCSASEPPLTVYRTTSPCFNPRRRRR